MFALINSKKKKNIIKKKYHFFNSIMQHVFKSNTHQHCTSYGKRFVLPPLIFCQTYLVKLYMK